jgi:hypothetical protein
MENLPQTSAEPRSSPALYPYLAAILIVYQGASSLWDIILSHFQGPVEAGAVAESSRWQLADVVASQFRRAFAPNGRLGIVGKG